MAWEANMLRFSSFILLIFLLLAGGSAQVSAQESPIQLFPPVPQSTTDGVIKSSFESGGGGSVNPSSGTMQEESGHKDLYSGDLMTRMRLTGTWFGTREWLAEKGVTYDFFATQFYQGIDSGGRQQEYQYGGKLDYLLNVDGQKLGLWEGLLVNFHAETRYGKSVNNIDGMLTPSNIAMNFPEPDRTVTAITGLKISQALSENFAVYFGKINTLDEFPIRYSPGLGTNKPGLEGFMNTSLVFNPIVARTLPYSTAGAGFAIVRDREPVFTLTVFDPDERANRGMDNLFARGAVIMPDLILRGEILNRPSILNLGGTYSSASYRTFDPAAYLNVPLGELLLDEIRKGEHEGLGPQKTGSWSIYGNVYQALWVDPNDPKRTWGIFGLAGLSDGNPNPVSYNAGGGIGGRSMIPGRTLDTFGIGYYYVGLSNNFKTLAQPLLPQQDEKGLELFYNYAITPWCRLTGDMQIDRPSTVQFNTAIITGLRLQILF